MKKIVWMCVLWFTAISINAQKAQQRGYVCTGNNVNVRTGPGKSYPIYDGGYGPGGKRQLFKGDVVLDCGKKKNGFCLIIGALEWGGDERDGWVSAQYLRPVILCPVCDGTKSENISKDEIDLINCRNCKGKGFIK